MSWSSLDEWREKIAEERREQEEHLIGMPCMLCRFRAECIFNFNYEVCDIAFFNEDEETWEVDLSKK